MKSWLWTMLAAFGVACAGTSQVAEAPKSGAEDAAADASSGKEGDETGAAEGDEAVEGEGDKKEEKTASNLRSSPTEILTAEETVFVLRFQDSEPGERAAEACDKRFRDSPKKYNACMAKAATQVKGNTLTFKKGMDGSWTWTTYDKRGTSLKKLKSVKFEIGEEKGNTVKLKLLSGSKGQVMIEVPNDYSIAIQDPKHGKLVYEAKIGIVGVEQDG